MLTAEQTEKHRQVFERVHPVPENIIWVVNNYMTNSYSRELAKYRALFECWISAIENTEIDLSRLYEHRFNFAPYFSDVFYDKEDVASQLKAQGFKVKV
jgi:hypothetical protein